MDPSITTFSSGAGGVHAVSRQRWALLCVKAAVAGAAIATAPVVLPAVVLLSTLGIALSFPFGVYLAGFACTEKLMQSLLPVSVNRGAFYCNEDDELVEGLDGDWNESERVRIENDKLVEDLGTENDGTLGSKNGAGIATSNERREVGGRWDWNEDEGVDVENLGTENEGALEFESGYENCDRIVSCNERQELDGTGKGDSFADDCNSIVENSLGRNVENLEFRSGNRSGLSVSERNVGEELDLSVLACQSESDGVAENFTGNVQKKGNDAVEDVKSSTLQTLLEQREVEDDAEKADENAHRVACEGEKPNFSIVAEEVEVETKVLSFMPEDLGIEDGQGVSVEQAQVDQAAEELIFGDQGANELEKEQGASAIAIPESNESLPIKLPSVLVDEVETEYIGSNISEPSVEHVVYVQTMEVVEERADQEREKNLQIGGAKDSGHSFAFGFHNNEDKRLCAVISSGHDSDNEQTSGGASDYVSAIGTLSSAITDTESAAAEEHFSDPMSEPASMAGSERELMISPDEELYRENNLWKQVYALRAILGYTAALHTSLAEECGVLFDFVGVEPPIPLSANSGLKDLHDGLQFLKSVIGVQ